MNAAKKIAGITLALAAAGLFANAGMVRAEEGLVLCQGVNACKGKGDCATAHNACKGQNDCKGKGAVTLDKRQCEQAQAGKNSNPAPRGGYGY
ncbi:MAG: BufA2 family periplasmic bufferin-type metallophore [Burkholderiales bacterium]